MTFVIYVLHGILSINTDVCLNAQLNSSYILYIHAVSCCCCVALDVLDERMKLNEIQEVKLDCVSLGGLALSYECVVRRVSLKWRAA